FSGRRRHTRSKRDWSSDVCSSDLLLTLVCALTLLPHAMSPAAAAPADDDPDPAEITLERVTPDYLDEEDDLTLAGKITNHGDSPLSNVTVWWRMLTHVPSDEGLAEWLREE